MTKETKMTVSASPHIRSASTTTGIMLDVIVALIPALIVAVAIFGYRVLAVCGVTVGTVMLSEYIARKVMKRPGTLGDLSAVVTGLILAFNLPVSIRCGWRPSARWWPSSSSSSFSAASARTLSTRR